METEEWSGEAREYMKHDGGDIQSSSGCSSDVQLAYDVNRNNKLCLLLKKDKHDGRMCQLFMLSEKIGRLSRSKS